MKIAILGSGKMGRSVIKQLEKSATDLDITAYDTSLSALETVKAETQARCVNNLAEVLDNPSIKLVFVTAANDAHKDLVLASIAAGKAVMCEKPIATAYADAKEMVEASEKAGVFFQIGFELRYSTLYNTVKSWIDRDALGEIRNIQCNYICSEFWGPDSWKHKKTAGSMFGEKLSHYVDMPRWWTGKDATEVYAMSSPNVVPYFEVQDNYHASIKFAGGAVSHLTFMMPFASSSDGDPLGDNISRQKDDGHELRFLIMGTKGGVETNVFHRSLRRWEYSLKDGAFKSRLAEEISWSPEEDHSYFHNTTDQALDIIRRVKNGLPPMTSSRDSLETMRVCDAVDRSVSKNRLIRLADFQPDRAEND